MSDKAIEVALFNTGEALLLITAVILLGLIVAVIGDLYRGDTDDY